MTIAETRPPHSGPPIESDKEFFGKSGPIPATFDDARRFPRFYYRAYVHATVYPPRADMGEPEHCTILTRDLSRGGLSFLHIGQLFPGQRLDVVLNDGIKRAVEVQWCRRLRDRCYLGGCRFIKQEGEPEDPPPQELQQHEQQAAQGATSPPPPPSDTPPEDDSFDMRVT